VLDELPNVRVFIYQKAGGAALPALCHDEFYSVTCKTLPNLGRESYAYLYHMINHYDDKSRARKTVFSQCNAPTPGYHHVSHSGGHLTPDSDFFYDYMSPFAPPRAVPTYWRSVYGKSMAIRKDYQSLVPTFNASYAAKHVPAMCLSNQSDWLAWEDATNPWGARLSRQTDQEATTLEFWNRYFKPYFGPFSSNRFFFANGAIFSISSQEWLARPKAFYEALFLSVSMYEDPVSGYHLEHLWGYLAGHGHVFDAECPKYAANY